MILHLYVRQQGRRLTYVNSQDRYSERSSLPAIPEKSGLSQMREKVAGIILLRLSMSKIDRAAEVRLCGKI
jgi:hypothetical protein